MKKFFEKHDLVKMILIAIVFTLILTWIIPSGTFQGTTVAGTMQRTGISDVFLGGMMSVSFFLQQMLYVVVVGAFYGILMNMDGYKKLVGDLAKKMKGHETIFVILISLLVAGFTSMTTNMFVLFLFIPLIISVIRKMGLDNITAYVTTFGSMLIGILGATFGTEGLLSFINYLKYYTTATVDIEIMVRAGILLLAFILFNFFTVTHVKKILAKKSNKEEKEDIFAVEEPKQKKTKSWPVVVGFSILFLFMVLGFVDWQTNFNISIFTEFHTWLTNLAVGEYTIIAYILGANSAAFGTWQLYHMITIMAIVLFVLAFIYRVNFDTMLEGIETGITKILKLIGMMSLVFVVFVFMYWSPIVPSIVSWVNGLAEGFNPYLSAISASISTFFHADFGYTGYTLGNLLASYEGDSFNIAFVIYTTMNGLISMIAPTSIITMIGLSYCEIPYKKWFSYIWKFFLGMLICLLVIFTLLTYL